MKHGLMIGTFGFFFGVTKLGTINKIFFSMILSSFFVFIHKCNFYQKMVEELNQDMDLQDIEAVIADVEPVLSPDE